MKGHWGWHPLRLLLLEDGDVVGAASVLRRPVASTPFCLLYAPKGPAFDYEDVTLWPRVLQTLEELARQQRAILLKIDPDLEQNAEADSTRTGAPARVVLRLLQERGWRFSPEQIQFRKTVVVHFRPSEEDILAGMDSKTRYNIRLAERRGVRVREAGVEKPSAFYRLYAETSARDKFPIRALAYYQDAW